MAKDTPVPGIRQVAPREAAVVAAAPRQGHGRDMAFRLHLSTLAGFAILSLAAAGGCGGSGSTSSGGGGSSSAGSTSHASGGTTTSSSTASSSSGSAPCPTTSTTMLPGVHLEIDGAACTFSLADPVAKVAIPYHVVVDQDVTGVTPRTQDGGQCGKPGSSGLIIFEKVDGNAQHYCLCDIGQCPPSTSPPVTLKKGSYPSTFTWDKNNWFGPSDTNKPEGQAFPVGDYTFTVSAIGLQTTSSGDMGFVITGTLPIHLIP